MDKTEIKNLKKEKLDKNDNVVQPQQEESIDHPRMNELRAKVLDYLKENETVFHSDDIELLKTNNFWINRFLNFCDQSFDSAFKHLIDTFKFRKETGIKSIDKASIPLECWLASTAFIYLPDKQGCPTLYIRVSKHVKCDEKLMDLFKKFLHVLIDEIDTLASKEHGYNVFLDLYNMAWKNFDLDMLYYLLYTSRYRYPNG